MYSSSTSVLVVDDMKVMRSLVKNALRKLGITEFTEAENGAIAWRLLSAANPPIGLIISDWNMPEMTGIEFLKKVRAEEKFKDLPFVLLTAEGEKSQVAEALQSGVDNYILKPFTAEILKQKLEAVYSRKPA